MPSLTIMERCISYENKFISEREEEKLKKLKDLFEEKRTPVTRFTAFFCQISENIQRCI